MDALYLFQNPSPGNSGSMLPLLFPMLLVLVFFVFFIYIPQNRQRKQLQAFNDSLKEGMDIVTSSGIVGRITKVEDKTVRLLIDEKTFMRVLKSSITSEFKA